MYTLIYIINTYISSKEAWKLNLRQNAQMVKSAAAARKKLKHGQSQKGEQKRWRSSDMEKVRRDNIRDGEVKRLRKSEERRCRCAKKVGKSRNNVFFQSFVAAEGRKVGSLKRQVQRHLGR